MRTALESADQQLNFVFKRLLVSATPEKSSQLRERQRSWLQLRNTTCGLSAAGTSAANWLATIARDKTKANCLYDQTMARLSELQDSPTDNSEDEYVEKQEYMFPASRESGKLYAEVTLYVKGADQGTDTTTMQIGISDNKSVMGTQLNTAELARKANANGDFVYGMAVDLDSGKYYYSENGRWITTPGSVDGADFKRGPHYSIRLSTPGKLLSRFMQLAR